MGQIFAKLLKIIKTCFSSDDKKTSQHYNQTSQPNCIKQSSCKDPSDHQVEQYYYDHPHVVAIPRKDEYQETSVTPAELEEDNECLITIPESHIVYISSFGVGVQPEPKIWIKHYCSSHKILLVGDGDFSFSACLAKAFGSAANMVATSLDSLEFLTKNYSKAMSNINYLKNNRGTVRHNFDVTVMWNNRHLIVDSDTRFDRIVYNFPLAGFFRHLTREHRLQYNRCLVRSFMQNARKMIEDDGEIHITHKSNGFFHDWDLADLAKQTGLKLIEDVKFILRDYPGYRTKYGFGGDDNFQCHPSRTYKFSLNS